MLAPLLVCAGLALPACGEKGGESSHPDSDAANDTGTPAIAIAIASPADGESVLLGESIALEATCNATGASFTWTSSQEGDVATGIATTWTPALAGDHELIATATDGDRTASDSVSIFVREPVPESVTVWDDAAGVPTGAVWTGLVIHGGRVYGSTSVGLVVFSSESATVFTIADGLATDALTAVAVDAYSMVWVGFHGVEGLQGHQFILYDGVLTLQRDVVFDRTGEILGTFRMRTQPYGAGQGDVWMGSNEGLVMFDQDLGVFLEHLHPVHPHGFTRGLAFSSDGSIWNGDEYQLSRFLYRDDGSFSSSGNLVEIVQVWEEAIEDTAAGEEDVPVVIEDVDVGPDGSVWVASSLFGVARVTPGTPSMVERDLAGMPAAAAAVRVDPDGNAWIAGASEGLTVWETATGEARPIGASWLPGATVYEIAIDTTTEPATVWLATAGGLVAVVGVPDE